MSWWWRWNGMEWVPKRDPDRSKGTFVGPIPEPPSIYPPLRLPVPKSNPRANTATYLRLQGATFREIGLALDISMGHARELVRAEFNRHHWFKENPTADDLLMQKLENPSLRLPTWERVMLAHRAKEVLDRLDWLNPTPARPQATPTAARNRAIWKARESGRTLASIGDEYNLSSNRIWQILRKEARKRGVEWRKNLARVQPPP